MNPTMRFRWVAVSDQEYHHPTTPQAHFGFTQCKLQQRHEGMKGGDRYEAWLDVPYVIETPTSCSNTKETT